MRSAFDLTGRTVLVTGAAAGIGAATARVCAAQGARVVLVDREDAAPLAAELGGTAFRIDVGVRKEVESILAWQARSTRWWPMPPSARGTTGTMTAGTRPSSG